MPKLSHSSARLLLAQQRPMTSLVDREIASAGPDLVYTSADWVPLYFDRGHGVTSDCGKITAFRALTLKGHFLWMVFARDKARGFHASTDDPHRAIEMALTAWAHRRAVRQDWHRVEATARDLIWGRQRFDVRREDLHASPLCSLGAEGFLAAIGAGRAQRLPGRLAALLMKIEPQMGFVIYEAMRREAAARAPEQDRVAAPA